MVERGRANLFEQSILSEEEKKKKKTGEKSDSSIVFKVDMH